MLVEGPQRALASSSVNTPQGFSFLGDEGVGGGDIWPLSTQKAQRGPGADVTETGVQIR